jgi:hypothetical protein
VTRFLALASGDHVTSDGTRGFRCEANAATRYSLDRVS